MEFVKRPTYASINLNHLRHNAKLLKSRLSDQQEILAVIKANAYGHGAIFVARALEGVGIKKLAVATYSEGIELREQGIKAEIYVLNGILGPISDYISYRLYPVIFELDQLKVLNDYLIEENREFNACLKFDTGMGRLGFSPSQIDQIIKILGYKNYLKIVCAMTHLAKADSEDDELTKRQMTLFKKLQDIIEDRGLKKLQYSICNSAALLDNKLEGDWFRPGIALYGCYPHPRHRTSLDLKPVFELKTKILSLKTVMPHSPIGYGATFTTERESKIAILPVGYADGYPRLASNRGHVLVKGHKAPVIGRVSMDLMAVDVTDVPDVALYDDVVVIGQDGDEIIRAEDVAEWAETISYEILCGISTRVPRVYIGM